jgi:hypothetical protein
MPSEPKNTPGPWESDSEFTPWHSGGVPAIAIFSRKSNGIGWPVAWSHPYGYERETAQADARLMSASPEMLEALERMLKHFSDQDGGLCIECGEVTGKGKGCDTCYVLELAEAAIKKARG